jgi:hypothetical protein
MQRAGWLSQYHPDPPPRFERPLTTWFGSIPEPAANGEGPWIEFEGADVDGRSIVWRLSVEPNETNGLRTIRLIRTRSGEPPVDQRFVVDVAAFEAGKQPGEFLRWPDGAPDDAARAAAETLLRGFPEPEDYREGVIRYVRTAARHDAFRCQRAARQLYYKPPGAPHHLLVRTDLWLAPEVPFGVVLVETKVTDGADVVSQRRLLVRDYGPK